MSLWRAAYTQGQPMRKGPPTRPQSRTDLQARKKPRTPAHGPKIAWCKINALRFINFKVDRPV